METTKIAELAKILKDNGLTKLDLTEGDNRLVLEAVSAPVAPAVVMPAAVPVEAVPVAAAEAPAAAPEAPAAPEEDLYEQKTPLVGTVCAAPYVSVGDHVAAGDTVCIVESMKMFNEIAAECSGTIEEICINNGQIVEYVQVLFRIRED